MLTLLLSLSLSPDISLSLLVSRNNVFQDDRPATDLRKDKDSDMAGTTFKNFCTGAIKDCGAWNEAEGHGSFFHKWGGCCADGIVMGPFPDAASGGFTLNFELVANEENNVFRFGSYNDGVMSFVSMNENQFTKWNIVGRDCNEYCQSFTVYGSCVYGSGEQCGWCASDNACKSKEVPMPRCTSSTPFAFQSLHLGILDPAGCNGGCSAKTTCGTCAKDVGCVWCDGACVDGVGDSVNHWVCGGKVCYWYGIV
jgi:hypothetical protein